MPGTTPGHGGLDDRSTHAAESAPVIRRPCGRRNTRISEVDVAVGWRRVQRSNGSMSEWGLHELARRRARHLTACDLPRTSRGSTCWTVATCSICSSVDEHWPRREAVASCFGRGRSAALWLASTGDVFSATLSRFLPCGALQGVVTDPLKVGWNQALARSLPRPECPVCPVGSKDRGLPAKVGKCRERLYRDRGVKLPPISLSLSLFS